MGDYFMVAVYWFLTAFWLAGLAWVVFLFLNPAGELPYNKSQKKVLFLLGIIALVFLLDSVYWSVTNTSRIGLISRTISGYLYNGWYVGGIKLLVLISAFVFAGAIVSLFKSYQSIEDNFAIRQTIELTEDPIGILDLNGKVLYWNEGATLEYGFTKSDAEGNNIADFFVPFTRRVELKEKMAWIIRTGNAAKDYKTERNVKGGGIVPVNISITPIKDQHSKVIGFFGILRKERYPTIFLCHGRNPEWRHLFHHLKDDHLINVKAYEYSSGTGSHVFDNVTEMIGQCNIALIFMTGDDILQDGVRRARSNVMHELGLCHQKLGKRNTVIVNEEGIEIPTNIDGIQRIQFKSGNLECINGKLIAEINKIWNHKG